MFRAKTKGKRCVDCKWRKKNAKNHENFYTDCNNTEVHKGYSCGNESNPTFRFYVRKRWKLWRPK